MVMKKERRSDKRNKPNKIILVIIIICAIIIIFGGIFILYKNFSFTGKVSQETTPKLPTPIAVNGLINYFMAINTINYPLINISVYAQDMTQGKARAGVFSGYINLFTKEDTLEFIPGSLVISPKFSNGNTGKVTSDKKAVINMGGFSTSSIAPYEEKSDKQLLFKIQAKALTKEISKNNELITISPVGEYYATYESTIFGNENGDKYINPKDFLVQIALIKSGSSISRIPYLDKIKINSAVIYSNNILNISIKRDLGSTEFTKYKLILYNGDGTIDFKSINSKGRKEIDSGINLSYKISKKPYQIEFVPLDNMGIPGIPASLDVDICKPVCGGRSCGSDSCGGSCGKCSGTTLKCDVSGQCKQCLVDKDCKNKKLVCNKIGTCVALGYLVVKSDPDKAEVYLNNNYIGTTPFKESARLAPGTYSVKVSKKGYMDYINNNVIIKEGEYITLDGKQVKLKIK